MSSNRSIPSLTSSESAELTQYRSLSGLALCAGLMGVLSVAALAHPAAWFIPGLAVLCGLWGLARIYHHSDTLMGRNLALGGLLLGVFFGVCAATRYFFDRWVLEQRAREFLTQWLENVREGHLDAAHQATLDVRQRQPEGTLLDEFYRQSNDAELDRETFFAGDMPRRLKEISPNFEIQFERSLGQSSDRGTVYVTQRFRLRPNDPAKPSLHLQLEAKRDQDRFGIYWTLVGLVDADEIDSVRRERGRR